jgi:signal transduction histidine kinase
MIKKFFVMYIILLVITAAVTAAVYNLYLSNIGQVIADVSRNAVMINDTFTLKQNVSPLVSGDIFEVTIFNAINQQVYFHDTPNQFFIYASKTLYIDQKENPIFTIVIKSSLLKVILLYTALTALMSLLYFPFRRFEYRQYEHQRNESIASLTRKVAHDIRSPMSTLNLISSQIKDENIKSLQLAVVRQINAIAEDLLEKNRSLNESLIAINQEISGNYFSFFQQIESEYIAKKIIHQRNIIFDIDASLKKLEARHQKILYPILCNFLNNSIEATEEKNCQIKLCAKQAGKKIVIFISDNGSGIPPEVLSEIGNRPLSYGKNNQKEPGNGLAIFNAKQDLKLIGAQLEIRSVVEEFTEIKITIPI